MQVNSDLSIHWNSVWQGNSAPLVWKLNEPHHNLINWFNKQTTKPKTILEIGCGIGNNAIWLAQQGASVTAIDIATIPIDVAQQSARQANVSVNFNVVNALDGLPSGPFDLVFDYGCFHCLNYPGDRAKFAKEVAKVLGVNGQWVSVIGSPENVKDPELGPPRRSIVEIAQAVEPSLKIINIVEIESELTFNAGDKTPRPYWLMTAGKRLVPASGWPPPSKKLIKP
jgi:SAM-dependent methyltransferase